MWEDFASRRGRGGWDPSSHLCATLIEFLTSVGLGGWMATYSKDYPDSPPAEQEEALFVSPCPTPPPGLALPAPPLAELAPLPISAIALRGYLDLVGAP